jgi:phytoene dehydrogenase-like protein
VKRNVVVVGGGLAGLAASIYLARGGRTVTLFEKRRSLGGRAMTTLRHGYRFNLGAHGFSRDGIGARVCRELGIPVRGKLAKPRAFALVGRDELRLPTNWISLITTSLLSLRGKRELAMALLHVRRFGGTRAESMTLREWIDARIGDERARAVLEALVRLATYSDHAEIESAALALEQTRIVMRGTLYIDEGWQKIVDSMRSAAISSGVNFVSSSRIVGVVQDGAVRAVELGGLEFESDLADTLAIAYPEPQPEEIEGALIPAETVVLAVDPTTAAQLAGNAGAEWANARPVTAACLDVALRSLPQPKNTFALGIDRPLYYSVHSAFAQLAPKGGALVHTTKYNKDRLATNEELEGSRPRRTSAAIEDEQELEALLDRMQPGWREVLVHRRFLPAMTVTNCLVTPQTKRPSPIVTGVRGLYIAGDWVGDEGMLSDASFASARAAAKAILAD